MLKSFYRSYHTAILTMLAFATAVGCYLGGYRDGKEGEREVFLPKVQALEDSLSAARSKAAIYKVMSDGCSDELKKMTATVQEFEQSLVTCTKIAKELRLYRMGLNPPRTTFYLP